ncbi:hypothetical protein NLI96_g488 [Meripilus lineatus]|uniref:Mid2 domain-containing protein n=1 Tax=Meripilus lineatus TaxID=2056292 RepID=A0AAD5YJ95_9APHY|nr:hypothetical protein NLI96_g488 [Physisporinus lineatus]
MTVSVSSDFVQSSDIAITLPPSSASDSTPFSNPVTTGTTPPPSSAPSSTAPPVSRQMTSQSPFPASPQAPIPSVGSPSKATSSPTPVPVSETTDLSTSDPSSSQQASQTLRSLAASPSDVSQPTSTTTNGANSTIVLSSTRSLSSEIPQTPTPSSTSPKSRNVGLVVGAALGGAILVIIIGALFLRARIKKRPRDIGETCGTVLTDFAHVNPVLDVDVSPYPNEDQSIQQPSRPVSQRTEKTALADQSDTVMGSSAGEHSIVAEATSSASGTLPHRDTTPLVGPSNGNKRVTMSSDNRSAETLDSSRAPRLLNEPSPSPMGVLSEFRALFSTHTGFRRGWRRDRGSADSNPVDAPPPYSVI